MRTFLKGTRRGFTLIELMVVIAILAALATIAGPAIMARIGLGDESKCRSNLEQLAQLGTKYGQDVSHRAMLPTSGMDDDEDTATVNEGDGWWLSLAPELDTVVYPQKAGGKMKVSSIFHCPADTRQSVGNDPMFAADEKSVSYVSWSDGTEDPDNPNSCIRLTAKQNLDALPWLSDGEPVKGASVTDTESFKKQVMPAIKRHGEKIMVLYASGVVKAVVLEEGTSAAEGFKKVAPQLAAKASKKGKKGKKGGKSRDADDDEED